MLLRTWEKWNTSWTPFSLLAILFCRQQVLFSSGLNMVQYIVDLVFLVPKSVWHLSLARPLGTQGLQFGIVVLGVLCPHNSFVVLPALGGFYVMNSTWISSISILELEEAATTSVALWSLVLCFDPLTSVTLITYRAICLFIFLHQNVPFTSRYIFVLPGCMVCTG